MIAIGDGLSIDSRRITAASSFSCLGFIWEPVAFFCLFFFIPGVVAAAAVVVVVVVVVSVSGAPMTSSFTARAGNQVSIRPL